MIQLMIPKIFRMLLATYHNLALEIMKKNKYGILLRRFSVLETFTLTKTTPRNVSILFSPAFPSEHDKKLVFLAFVLVDGKGENIEPPSSEKEYPNNQDLISCAQLFGCNPALLHTALTLRSMRSSAKKSRFGSL